MSNRKSNAEQRLFEERIYAQVVDELAQGNRRDGLWAKAISESGGSIDSAKGLYIRYRVQSIMDEIELTARRELEKSKAQEDKQNFEFKKAQQEQSKLKRQETIRIVKKFFHGSILFIFFFFLLFALIEAIYLYAPILGGKDGIINKIDDGILVTLLAVLSYFLVRLYYKYIT